MVGDVGFPGRLPPGSVGDAGMPGLPGLN
ncbi:unnamed protein product, partial [Allacma fusca]